MTKVNAVLVTTKHRGVFFGYVENDKKAPAEITLTGCRCCIYWSANVGGFLGLTTKGPTKSCKIGTRAPKVTLYELTSVSLVEDAAIEAWEKA